jgi:hypothetical protein
VLTGGSAVVQRRQGVVGGESRIAPERRADGEAAQMASGGGRVAPVVVDEHGEVLQLEGDQQGEEAAID